MNQLGHQSEVHSQDKLDQWGASLGFLCAIHCALTPLSMLFVPIFGLGTFWTLKGEIFLLSFAFIFMIPSFISAWRRGQSTLILSAFLASWILLGTAFYLKLQEPHDDPIGDQHHHETAQLVHTHSTQSIILSVLGGLGLMSAHIMNLRRRKEAHQSCCAHD